MTFEEVARKLPNGFHDAKIRSIRADFINRSITLGMDLHVGAPGDPDPEPYRPGTLSIAPLCLFFVEPPDLRYPFDSKGSPLNVDGDSVRVGQSPEVDRLLPVLPANASLYRFFLEEWNSFLYLGGDSVLFSWDDGGTFT
jgi:hypothetical protein